MGGRLISVQFRGVEEEPKIIIYSDGLDDEKKGLIEQEILEIKFELARMIGPFGTVSVDQRSRGSAIRFDYDKSKWDGQCKYRLNKDYRLKFIAWLERL